MGPAAPGRIPDSVRQGGGWQGIHRWARARGGCQVVSTRRIALLRAPHRWPQSLAEL